MFPRIVGRTVKAGVGAVGATKFTRRSLGQQNCPGLFEPSDIGIGVVSNVVLKDEARFSLRPTAFRIEFFDPCWHTAKGKGDVSRLGLLQCTITIDKTNGIEVGRSNCGNACGDYFLWVHLTGAIGVDKCTCIE